MERYTAFIGIKPLPPLHPDFIKELEEAIQSGIKEIWTTEQYDIDIYDNATTRLTPALIYRTAEDMDSYKKLRSSFKMPWDNNGKWWARGTHTSWGPEPEYVHMSDSAEEHLIKQMKGETYTEPNWGVPPMTVEEIKKFMKHHNIKFNKP